MTTLEESYRRCREINRHHGATYYRSAQLLPRTRRRHVHALYAFARTADDLVDLIGSVDERAADLASFRTRFAAALEQGSSTDPVLNAVVDTAVRFEIEPAMFDRFFASMEMDLRTSSYEAWDDLLGYMDGSAAVIGEMMLPILGPRDPDAALEPARRLGLAFQLTNFLRDVGEDLDRGRQYLPQEDLRRFGVELTERSVTPEFRELMRFEIARCRELYESAREGMALLPPRSARCIRASHSLYGRILDEIERLDFDVFSHRATVSSAKKLQIIAGELLVPRRG